MPNEIDRLEITVEAEANKANRALSAMEKRLNSIAGSIEKVVSLTSAIDGFGKFNTSGFDKVQKEIDGIINASKKASRITASPRINRSDIKYATKSLDELYDKFKKAGTGLDVSKMGLPELQKGLRASELAAQRLNDRLEKKISIEGTKQLGKSWENLIYDIQKATNQAEIYSNAIDKIKKKLPEFTITRGRTEKASDLGQTTSYVSKDSLGYNPEAMRMVFGEGTENLKNFDDVVKKFGGSASAAGKAINDFQGQFENEKINTYESQIKKLKSDLSEIASKGYKQGDANYDKLARQLALVTEQKKKYDKEMRNSAKAAIGLDDTNKKLKKLNSSLNKARKSAGLFSSAISKIKSYRKGISDLSKALNIGSKGRKGMSWGRMIGSSVLFSFVFQGISAIQNAIKEGSDNLVQYSSEYNHSISSMVTSLLYLQNAWAAAFSPIVNVVAPYISSFIDMIASALNSVGQFLAALTGKGFAVQAKKVWKDYAEGLKDAGTGGSDAAKGLDDAAKAAKELQSYTLGIDELNILEPNKDSGSGSGAGGNGSGSGSGGGVGEISPSEMFETVEISDSMNKLAEMFKEALRTSDFTEIGKLVSDKISDALESINWDSVYQKAENFGKGLATFLNGLINPRLFRNIGGTIAKSINTIFTGANSFAKNLDWKNLGNSLASGVDQFFTDWDAGLTAETFGNFVSGILEALTAAITTLGEENTFEKIGQKLVDFICGVDWKSLSWDLAEFLLGFEKAVVDLPNDLARGVNQAIIDKIFGADSGIEVPEIALPPGSLLYLYAQFDEIKQNALETGLDISTRFQEAWDLVEKSWDQGDSFFGGLWKGIQYIFSPVEKWFENNFGKAYAGIQNIFSPIAGWFSDKWNSIKKVFDKDTVKDFFYSGFKAAYDAATGVWNGIGDFFRNIANNAIAPIGKLVNGIIDGINWVSDKLGAGNVLKNWNVPRFARGTNGLSTNTMAVVNDQSGSTYRELVQLPNGKTFIPKGRNVMLPLPKGTKVMPAGQTKDLMKSFPHFKGGIGDFFHGAWEKLSDIVGSIWDYATHPDKLIQIAINKFVDISNMTSPWSDIAGGVVNKIFDGAVDYVKKLFDKAMPVVNYSASAGVNQWRQLASKALEMTGQFSDANLNLLLYQMQTESGGNPNAINNWDINAKRGTPSKGLMQVIDPTFKAYAYPGYSSNIWDPLSNMLAAIRYTLSRYGSLANGWKGHGYADGGFPSTGEVFLARERGPELVGRIGNRNAVANNNQIVDAVSRGVENSFDRGTALLLNEMETIIEYQKELLNKNTSVNIDGKKADKSLSKARKNTGYSFSTT